MALIDIINKKNNKQNAPDPNELNVQELEYLLNTLKKTALLGEQVETFYNLVVKLQNQYISLTKQ
jgi:hypothetical protein